MPFDFDEIRNSDPIFSDTPISKTPKQAPQQEARSGFLDGLKANVVNAATLGLDDELYGYGVGGAEYLGRQAASALGYDTYKPYE